MTTIRRTRPSSAARVIALIRTMRYVGNAPTNKRMRTIIKIVDSMIFLFKARDGSTPRAGKCSLHCVTCGDALHLAIRMYELRNETKC
jgi:hypothetical protein